MSVRNKITDQYKLLIWSSWTWHGVLHTMEPLDLEQMVLGVRNYDGRLRKTDKEI